MEGACQQGNDDAVTTAATSCGPSSADRQRELQRRWERRRERRGGWSLLSKASGRTGGEG